MDRGPLQAHFSYVGIQHQGERNIELASQGKDTVHGISGCFMVQPYHLHLGSHCEILGHSGLRCNCCPRGLSVMLSLLFPKSADICLDLQLIQIQASYLESNH